MDILTYLENGSLRIGIEIPEQPDCCCDEDGNRVHYEMPIVVIGDSTQDIPWRMVASMMSHKRGSCRFIMDLLLINGTCNRYVEACVNSVGKLESVKSISGTGVVHEIIHQRATTLQHRFSKDLNSNVLTAAQQFAVTNGIVIEQRHHE